MFKVDDSSFLTMVPKLLSSQKYVNLHYLIHKIKSSQVRFDTHPNNLKMNKNDFGFPQATTIFLMKKA